MKKLFMMMTMVATSAVALAQAPLKSGIDLTDLDRTVSPGESLLPIPVLARSTDWVRTTTNVLTLS